MVTEVQDPSKYGVVVADDNNKIERFVEKPQVYISNKINAGLYLFNTSIIDRIENRPTSIEREIFPKMAEAGDIYQMVLPGYWMDIGQPKDYLSGQTMYLQAQRANRSGILAEGDEELKQIAKNGFEVALVDEATRAKWTAAVDAV